MTRTERTRAGTSDRRLSVVVALRDAYTGGRPRGRPRVTLAERPERFTRNRSGYHVLTDLPGDVAAVTVEVDPGDRYLPERRVLDAASLGERPRVVEVDLLPSPAYPFPAGATLVRGAVGEADGDGLGTRLSGVELAVLVAPAGDAGAGDDAGADDAGVLGRGRSTEGGEYVVFLRGLTADTVTDGYDDEGDDAGGGGAGGRVVGVDGERPVVRAVDPDSGRETTVSVGVRPGTTASRDVAF